MPVTTRMTVTGLVVQGFQAKPSPHPNLQVASLVTKLLLMDEIRLTSWYGKCPYTYWTKNLAPIPTRWLALGFLKHQQCHKHLKLGKFSKSWRNQQTIDLQAVSADCHSGGKTAGMEERWLFIIKALCGKKILYFEWSPPWHVGWWLSGEGCHLLLFHGPWAEFSLEPSRTRRGAKNNHSTSWWFQPMSRIWESSPG